MASVNVAVLDEPTRNEVESQGERVAPGMVLLASEHLTDELVGMLVRGMEEGKDLKEGADKEEKMLALDQRRMVRVGFEPDVATWAWPVLTPAPGRFARAWLPAHGAVLPRPCFVPHRLKQPAATRRIVRSATERKRKDSGVYLVDDAEHHQSRVVLAAPGVDVTHPSIPTVWVEAVLAHAATATEFVFLVVASDLDRLSSLDWPGNVYPVAHVTSAEDLAPCVDAFARAGCRGVVVVEDAEDELFPEADFAFEHLSAVLVRGRETKRRALQSVLLLRGHGVRVQVGREVRERASEPIFDPTAFERATSDGEAAPETRATRPAVLPNTVQSTRS